jgi:hypothetical protein
VLTAYFGLTSWYRDLSQHPDTLYNCAIDVKKILDAFNFFVFFVKSSVDVMIFDLFVGAVFQY